jgi:hypothetical protein
MISPLVGVLGFPDIFEIVTVRSLSRVASFNLSGESYPDCKVGVEG